MDVTKPYKFIGFGAIDVTKPYKFIGFGAIDALGQRPFNFERSGGGVGNPAQAPSANETTVSLWEA